MNVLKEIIAFWDCLNMLFYSPSVNVWFSSVFFELNFNSSSNTYCVWWWIKQYANIPRQFRPCRFCIPHQHVGNAPICNLFRVKYNFQLCFRDPPVLRAHNSTNIILRLPMGRRIRDIRWLSVWCRRFTVSERKFRALYSQHDDNMWKKVYNNGLNILRNAAWRRKSCINY